MGKTLTEIAQTLKDANKKVQLIYAFNGVGKTRLSREFKELVAPKTEGEETDEEKPIKVLYYNAFTEDLFYWDNDLDEDTNRKLIKESNCADLSTQIPIFPKRPHSKSPIKSPNAVKSNMFRACLHFCFLISLDFALRHTQRDSGNLLLLISKLPQ